MILKVEEEALGVHLQEEAMVQEEDLAPPDIEEIIRNIQKTINRFIPGNGAKGGKPIIFRINNFSNNLDQQVACTECCQMNKELF